MDGAGLFRWLTVALASNLVFAWLLVALAYPIGLAVRLISKPAGTPRNSISPRFARRIVLLFGVLPFMAHAYTRLIQEAQGQFTQGSASWTLPLISVVIAHIALRKTFRLGPRALPFLERCRAAGGVATPVLLIAATVLVTAPSGSPAAAPGATAGPNILLVSIDSLRSDDLHSYGYQRDKSGDGPPGPGRCAV